MAKKAKKTARIDASAVEKAQRRTLLIFALLFCIYCAWMGWRIAYDPHIRFLLPRGEAKWIRFDEPLSPAAHQETKPTVRHFRKRFRTPAGTAQDLPIAVASTGAFDVLLDGQPVASGPKGSADWKTETLLNLPGLATPADHEIQITVSNPLGPALLRARCPVLGLDSNDSWESSQDGKTWRPAAPAGRPQIADMSRLFPRADADFLKRLPLIVVLAACAALFGLAGRAFPAARVLHPSPRTVKWAFMALLVLLGINNLMRLPWHKGFDVAYHVDYIWFLASRMRLPLATDGAQMFQPPLYYLVSAPLLRLFWVPAAPETAILALRILPLAAGMGQIEIAYRLLPSVFPNRKDLHIAGMAFTAFLPMNLYISQYPSNQPFEGFLSAVVILLALRILLDDDAAKHTRRTSVLGLTWGLALLSKVNALLLACPIMLALCLPRVAERAPAQQRLRRAARDVLVVFGTAAIVAGWYYLRNWIALGKPFVGGWDAMDGIAWWQDPGYRTIGQIVPRGEAFLYPVFAGAVSFWDGVYATLWADSLLSDTADFAARPPWNYSFMNATIWLSILPTVALLVGIARAFRRRDPQSTAVLFAFLVAAVYGLALFHHFLTVPYYCAVKSFYMVGAIPCLAILAMAGVDLIGRNAIVRGAIYSLWTAWAFCAYAAYLAQ